MNNSNAVGIVGVDGATPLYQPDGRWNMWSIHEIYRGNIGANKFIPKVNDYVIEPETGLMYIVTDLHNVTFIPELSPITIQKNIEVDKLLSSTNDNYRVYYDKSIYPYTLSVDGLLRIYSSSASFARIYKGPFIDSSEIISRMFDNSGNFVGHDIPLQLVAFNRHDNYAIKTIPTANTHAELSSGEVVTVVVFSSSGKVVTRVSCIVDETTFIAQAYAEQKYITNIFIKSVFIDDTQVNQINFPVNFNLNSFNPIGVVQYNDGSQVEYPVDGDKFRLYGTDMFLSSIVGHRVPLVLSYRLSPNESALASVTSDGHFITKPYTLLVSNPNRSYNVKLFVYPVWIDQINGYKYKAFLMSLDRNVVFDVTELIGLSNNSMAFNGTSYGITQRLTFSVNLSNVSSIYNHFVHAQTIDIVLRNRANDISATNIWEVSSQVPTNVAFFGTNLRASIDDVTRTRINIGNNISTVQEFIDRLYTTTEPLYNHITELSPPTPTHIEVRYLEERRVIPIENYDREIVFNSSIPLFSNIDIVFLKETPNNFLMLSVASLTVR